LWTRPAFLGFPWALPLDLVILDLWIYWWHRANHEIGLLWRFHEVHHRDRFLDATSALRFHFGEVMLSACVRAVPIVLLAIPLGSVMVFETLVLVAAIFHHSNARLPAPLEARLARWIITPSLHWVHHHATRSDTDSIYGTIFSFWDRRFGTAARNLRRPDMPIGVEGEDELSLARLIALPFHRG
jgi:sterol desaturase/sphingolipid hydroxylase (fatty acid hydroxylase superfamily)